jgi:hypothetical protein
LFRLFAHEIQLDGQLADLGVEAVALTLEILIRLFLAITTEDASGAPGHGLLPFGNLHRVDVEILRDLLDGLDALERFERDAGFEFWFAALTPSGLPVAVYLRCAPVLVRVFFFLLSFLWFSLGLLPTPDHHDHSLTPGPIFGVRLTQSMRTPQTEEKQAIQERRRIYWRLNWQARILDGGGSCWFSGARDPLKSILFHPVTLR